MDLWQYGIVVVCTVLVFGFYLYLSVKVRPKWYFICAFLTLLITAYLAGFADLLPLSIIGFLIPWLDMTIPPKALWLSLQGFGGLIEEFIRSLLSAWFILCLARHRRQQKVSAFMTDNYILALAVMYGIFESVNLVNGAFPNVMKSINAPFSPSKYTGFETPYLFLMAGALVLRFLVHFTLLRLSVNSLLSRKPVYFLSALVIHGAANMIMIAHSPGAFLPTYVWITTVEFLSIACAQYCYYRMNGAQMSH